MFSMIFGGLIEGIKGFFESKEKANISREERRIEAREPLYAELIDIIDSFPEETPLSILHFGMEYPPSFSGDYTIMYEIINYQIDDYNARIDELDMEKQRIPYNLQASLHNCEHTLKLMEKNELEYTTAKKRYDEFMKANNGRIKSISTQIVLNAIISFEVAEYNSFGPPGIIQSEEFQLAKNAIIMTLRDELKL